MKWEALNLTATEMRNFQRLRSVGQIYDQSPQTFIRFVGMMFQDLGYEVHTNADPESVGVDLYLRAKGKTALARCENYQGEIGKATINELFSQMSQVGVTDSFVVTTGHYASEAEFFAGGKPIQLIDGTDLWAWFEQSKATPIPAPQPVTRPKPEPVAEPIAKPVPEPKPAPVRKATPTRPPKPTVEKKRITPQAIIGILAACVLLFACFYLVQTLTKSTLVNDVLEDGDQTVITVPEPATATARALAPTDVSVPTTEPVQTTQPQQVTPEATAFVPPTITLASDALPTATTAPTVPANTPAPLDSSAFAIAKRSGSITADGNLSDWGNEATISSQHQVFAVTNWDNTDDVLANWQLSWDETNLYVSAVVTDDRHVQIAEPRFAYRGDSVEMQIDTSLSDDGNRQVNLDDFQVLFSPGNFDNIQPSSFRFRGNPSTGRPIAYEGQSVQVGAVKTSNGYTVEAIVPWSDLGVTPSQGLKLRMALNVSDNDTAGTTVQEVMKSHVASRQWRDPLTWALFQLGN